MNASPVQISIVDCYLSVREVLSGVSVYLDQLDGKGFLDNPYPQWSVEARHWVDGYVSSMIASRRKL